MIPLLPISSQLEFGDIKLTCKRIDLGIEMMKVNRTFNFIISEVSTKENWPTCLYEPFYLVCYIGINYDFIFYTNCWLRNASWLFCWGCTENTSSSIKLRLTVHLSIYTYCEIHCKLISRVPFEITVSII